MEYIADSSVNKSNSEWGFLREHSDNASGKDPLTGLHRTGLDKYLEVIFPDTADWIHDKAFGLHNNVSYRIRPDYRSDSLKMIVEFDGLPHYQDPAVIIKDDKNSEIYRQNGYKVVRIPYFIQLTNAAVEKLFGVKVNEPLFNIVHPSLGGIEMKHNPSCLCPEGLKRMAREFKRFPEQYEINIQSLKAMNDDMLSGVNYLIEEYNKL
ncbi:MAG: hypothetical protein J6Y55_01020 [Bacteroidales bacterium]|nr:hypothetical protein [Bacteroidales bacterium]